MGRRSRVTKGLVATALEDEQALVVSFNDQELDFYSADLLVDPLMAEIQPAFDSGTRHLVLNFDNVRVLDSSGVRLLMVIHNLAKLRGARIYLCHLGQVVTRVLELVGLFGVFSVFATEADALENIRTVARRV